MDNFFYFQPEKNMCVGSTPKSMVDDENERTYFEKGMIHLNITHTQRERSLIDFIFLNNIDDNDNEKCVK